MENTTTINRTRLGLYMNYDIVAYESVLRVVARYSSNDGSGGRIASTNKPIIIIIIILSHSMQSRGKEYKSAASDVWSSVLVVGGLGGYIRGGVFLASDSLITLGFGAYHKRCMLLMDWIEMNQ